MVFVGKSVPSKASLRHVKGQSQFVDDIKLYNGLYCAFVRSSYAHALIRHINTRAALNTRGVAAVITAEDLRGKVEPQEMKIPGASMKQFDYPFLAFERVRYVGEPIAAVVAANRYEAQDAVERVSVEYDPLDPVVDAEKALEPGSPLLYPKWGNNSMVKWEFSYGDIESAFSRADKIVSKKFEVNRQAGSPLEARAVIAEFDSHSQRLTIWNSKQDSQITKALTASALRLPESNVRVIVPDVGGGFGIKLNIFPEDVIVPYLAMSLKRPIKWAESRTEHLGTCSHSREMSNYIQLALKSTGEIMGLKSQIVGDLGAISLWPHSGAATILYCATSLQGPYDIKNVCWTADCVVTNKGPTGAYRGFGSPESTFARERLIDAAARDLQKDRMAFREMNLVKNFPYVYHDGQIHESGDFLGMLHKALEIINYENLAGSQHQRQKTTKPVGFGLAIYPEISACTQFAFGCAHEGVSLSIDEEGRITISSSEPEIGTNIGTIMCQVVADSFDVSPDDITIFTGDTQGSPYGMGLWGSRGAAMCGSASLLAAEKLREKALRIAANLLEARPEDLQVSKGVISVKGSREIQLSLRDVAAAAYRQIHKLPKGMEPGLSVTSYFNPSSITGIPDEKGRLNLTGAMASGVHAAVVEVDIETGRVKIVDYAIVHDSGMEMNPANVFGQIVGAAAQGLGAAMYEDLPYNDLGQPMAQTFVDYLMPTANEIPIMKVHGMEILSTTIPGGAKGAGENGIIGPPAAIANAVEDALHEYGVEIARTPVGPDYVWSLIHKSRA
jgi:aerobic carbon-monoxide dehydrogenase large subunit